MEEPKPSNFDLPYTRLPDEEAANEQAFIDPPPVPEQRSRQNFLKFFIVLLTAFFCVGLIFAFSKVVEFRSSSLGSPTHDEIDEVLPRGVAEGVSLKSFRWPVWELKLPAFPWSSKMLSWERTSFHFQPKKNWMNDPNGPLFYKGWYHLFYQYNPDGAVWGNKIVWGHAVSKDFMQWRHLPVAMYTDQWYDVNGVWTGSATILPDGQVIMLYTGSTNESVQVQNLAYPADPSDPLLVDWVKYPNNPVLFPPPGIGHKDFRDPTTAWLTSEGKWRIIIGSKLNKTGISLVYDTVDFKSYKLLKGLLHEVRGTGMWECVDFFPVSVDGTEGLDTSYMAEGVKHVVKVSLDDDRCDYYSLGTYEPKTPTWVPDNPNVDAGIGLRYDYGIYYASKTFYDPNKKRRILWGWIKETDSEKSDVKKGWASLQAVPRTILFDKKTGSNLIQWPVDEVEELRSNKKVFDKVEIKAGSVMPLDIGSAAQLDIKAEFELDEKAIERVNDQQVVYNCSGSGGAADRGALGPFGLLILADNDLTELTPVYFYISKGPDNNLHTLFCADHSRSSVAGDVDKGIYGSTVPVLNGEKLTVRILVDHSIVESFAQGGRTCITSRVYPTKAIGEKAKLYLFNNATESKISASVETYQMTMTTNAAQTYTRTTHIMMLALISLLLHWFLT